VDCLSNVFEERKKKGLNVPDVPNSRANLRPQDNYTVEAVITENIHHGADIFGAKPPQLKKREEQ